MYFQFPDRQNQPAPTVVCCCSTLQQQAPANTAGRKNPGPEAALSPVPIKQDILIKEEESKKNYGISNNTTNNYNSSTIVNTHSRTIKKNASSGTLDTYGESSTAIKLERERLRKLKEKQELNVKLQIDYECMREENRRKNMDG